MNSLELLLGPNWIQSMNPPAGAVIQSAKGHIIFTAPYLYFRRFEFTLDAKPLHPFCLSSDPQERCKQVLASLEAGVEMKRSSDLPLSTLDEAMKLLEDGKWDEFVKISGFVPPERTLVQTLENWVREVQPTPGLVIFTVHHLSIKLILKDPKGNEWEKKVKRVNPNAPLYCKKKNLDLIPLDPFL